MTKKPNIVFFCADQMRYDSLGCLGNALVRTPNIDSIAKSGTRFHRHRTPNQICSPSRATMFTGLYPRNHRLYKNGNALGPALPVLPGVLADQGYATHGAGKFHLQPLLAPADRGMPDSIAFWQTDAAKDWRGPFFGFATVDILLGEAQHCLLGGHYAEWFNANFPENAALYAPEASLSPVPEDLPEVWKSAIPPEQHYNSWIARRAVDFISSQDGEDPFFLYVSLPDPHHPFAPPAPYCDRYDPAEVPLPRVVAGELDRMPGYLQRDLADEWLAAAFGDYQAPPPGSMEQGMMIKTDAISEATLRGAIAHTYGMIEMIDDSVGTVMSAVSERGWDGDTIFLFTVDHGELLGDHGLLRKGAPPYDQLVRLPFILSGPGVPKDLDVATPTSHVDILATLCDLAGIEAPETDGLSLAPLMQGPADEWPRDAVFGEFYPRAHWDELNHSIHTGSWRLTLYPRQPGWGELFDHENDPGEHHNLFDDPAHSGTKAQLAERLSREFPAVLEESAEVLGSY
jgi:arylsulfatase A-like enzyme